MTRSLRARLLIGLVLLVAAGLLVSAASTYVALSTFVDNRLMDQLTGDRAAALAALGSSDSGPGGRGHSAPPAQFPTGTYGALYSPDGLTLLRDTGFGPDSTTPVARPSVPLPVPHGGPDVATWHTLSGSDGARYMVRTEMIDGAGDDILVLAVPLAEAHSTLNQLFLLEALISTAVLIALGLLAWRVIGIGLQPLERMGETAAAIAGGDLSRRVEPATRSTEIGRLGLALNAMLARIEESFVEKTRSERQLRQFLADASHELRTPLTSIRGYAEMLRRGAADSPDDSAKARRRIEEESVRMSILVDDLLLLARLDQGRPLERKPVDLQQIARDACDDARAVAPRRAINLLGSEALAVVGDDLRLRQVVGNLVRNAIIHTPPDTPIEVQLATSDGHALLSVVDHGPGLPKGEEKRVFEPFHRADPGRSRDRGGSGLGLSIVAAVVSAHGGMVEALPTEGGGATFRLELPLVSKPS
ncbi:MAG TPA: HAMP domain-containing sensor histidine kinase [Solirubrobacterales bacterium]|nr:HAMP domain-containing sensor histidine kinase [Solirubrobacterales bacterium]